MKSKKTYGAPGFMDWVAQITAGKAIVRIHFTGGSLTQYGVTPAEFTTDNLFIQRVIEGSSYFADGRIQLLRSVATDDAEREEKAEAEPVAETEAEEGTKADEKETDGIVVGCLQDAQAYLQKHFGTSTYKVRTRAQADEAGGQHGVKFVWS